MSAMPAAHSYVEDELAASEQRQGMETAID
jgi:hypothetical protein